MKTPENPFWKLLVGDIYSAAQRLNRLVKNLLDMSRLESGMLKLNLEWCDAGDLVSVVLRNLASELANHTVCVELQPELPLVRMDFVLMEQALANILLNAGQHTPVGTTITLRARVEDQKLAFIVEDEGPGFPPQTLDHILKNSFACPGREPAEPGWGFPLPAVLWRLTAAASARKTARPAGLGS